MNIEIAVGIIGGILAISGTIVGVYVKMSARHGRIYERLDETRTGIYEDVRSKDVCDERHKSLQIQLETIGSDMAEVKKDVKLLVRKNGLAPSPE